MNTPAHLLFGAGAFARPERKGSLTAALLGAGAPDLSLYAMVAVSLYVMDVPANVVFREYYYSDAWQAVFAVDNSFVLWGGLLAFALWRGWPLLSIFAASALFHIALDFPFHTHDARPHFWPVTDWVFHSPISYWDRGAHADVVGPLEAGFSLVFAGLLLWRFKRWTVRVLVMVLLAAELMSAGIWQFIF